MSETILPGCRSIFSIGDSYLCIIVYILFVFLQWLVPVLVGILTMQLLSILFAGVSGFILFFKNDTNRLVHFFVSVIVTIPGLIPRFLSFIILSGWFGYTPFVMALTAAVLVGFELSQQLVLRINRCIKEDYVEALLVRGVSKTYVLFVEILYFQCFSVFVKYIFIYLTFLLLVETTLGFLQFGVSAKYFSFGQLLLVPMKELGTLFIISQFDMKLLDALVKLLIPLSVFIGLITYFERMSESFSGNRDNVHR